MPLVTVDDRCRLRSALGVVGAHAESRAGVLAACHAIERLPEYRHTAVRDRITGPIVDALYTDSDVVRKELSNGLRFEFRYRSRIARDFVMSVPEKPDHVWEPQTTRLLLHLARGAKHVVVGGAYFGDQAILLAHALRESDGVCHAFEPDDDQRAMLARNVELNHLTNMRISGAGLWSDDVSRLRFIGEDAFASTAAADDGDASETVPSITLDTCLDDLGVADVQLIALDVEGGELAILEGARSRLALPPERAPHLVFEVHRAYVDWSNGLDQTPVFRYLDSLGYTAFAIRDFQSNYDMGDRPIELVPPGSAHLDGPPHGFNVVAVKRPEVLSGPRFRVCPGVSPKLLLHRDPALHHPLDGLV